MLESTAKSPNPCNPQIVTSISVGSIHGYAIVEGLLEPDIFHPDHEMDEDVAEKIIICLPVSHYCGLTLY